MRPALAPLAALTLGAISAGASLTGCAPRALAPIGAVGPEQARADVEREAAERRARDAERRRQPSEGLAPDAVYRAALPLHGVVLESGLAIEPDRLAARLAEADAICIGEDHDDVHAHWAELELFRRLRELAKMSGRALGLGLEMVQSTAQPELERYLDGTIDDAELRERLRWEKSWGYDFALTQPLVDAARRADAPLLALDVEHSLVRRVARGGLDALDPAERAKLPALDLRDREHHAAFEHAMREHPHPGSREHLYLAQVLRDEAIADTAAEWLAEGAPARQLVIIAGAEHCRRRAVPARLARRHGARVASVRPVVEGAAELPDAGDYDFAAVMVPERARP
ncbi:MAG: ChaN family lipoprotein [Polyangiaceae bacterium]|nr:ChaN family lipoprotein [Polyangiaceae bacterium]